MLRATLIIAALLAAGCSRDANKAHIKVDRSADGETVRLQGTGEDGTTSSFQAGDNVQAPQDLPSFVKLYPDLKLTSAMGGKGPQGNGGMLTGETAANLSEVAQFYRDHLKSLGFATQNESNLGDTIILSAVDGEQRTLTVAIAKADNGATVNLQYGERP